MTRIERHRRISRLNRLKEARAPLEEKSEPGPGTTEDVDADAGEALPPPTTAGSPPERKVGATKATTSQNLAKTEEEEEEFEAESTSPAARWSLEA